VAASARVPLAELGALAGVPVGVPVADLRRLTRGAKPDAIDGTTNAGNGTAAPGSTGRAASGG
jgi:hypothetical protein